MEKIIKYLKEEIQKEKNFNSQLWIVLRSKQAQTIVDDYEQKQELIERLEKENKDALDCIEGLQCKIVSKNAELFNLKKDNKQKDKEYESVIKRTNCLVYIDPQKNCETLKKMECEREYGKPYK